MQQLLIRYAAGSDSASITTLPSSFTPAKDAVRDFEKMKLAAFTQEELSIIEDILLAEITIAIRSMGNAKDYKEGELTLFINQVLDAFLVRGNTMSFASMLLFFKMRRNKQAPLNNVQYGVKPDAILDDLNAFIDWQRQKVTEAQANNPNKHLTLTQRSSALAGSLAAAPIETQIAFQEMKHRLANLEKQHKQEKQHFARMKVQESRLESLIYLECQNMAKAKERAKQLLAAWQPSNGNELKQLIDEHYPKDAAVKNLSISVGYADEACTVTKVHVQGHSGSYKINSDQ